ncbi:MAG: glycogen debranching protein [Lentisphaerae bacterium]|nr:glycogen debranching protein [Lentisphaerota bacterium]
MPQQKITGGRKIYFCGECAAFELSGIQDIPGRGVLRTNIGYAATTRDEICESLLKDKPAPGLDWHDFDMTPEGSGRYTLTLPLLETGCFEAKCCFIPDDGSPIIWAHGANFEIKVESSAAAAGNTIYCAFVRQFGKTLFLEHSGDTPAEAGVLDRQGYTVIPPSGTFRDLIRQLDHIFGTLRCRILQLLPVHPVPAQYGRMGRYGSPFAALDYFNVDPALAEFDTSATPLEQFGELIDAVHSRDGRIFMDMPVNHTGWASRTQIEHPEYFIRDSEGKFESPGAWGVVWADLCRLDYSKKEVTNLMADVFLFWCRRGIDGFRCDAGYMVPADAWSVIVSKVRSEYPDTVFLLEGLGGPLAVQDDLLRRRNLDWAYSELFQNYDRDSISGYLPGMLATAREAGSMICFAETHDNNRLAAYGKRFAKLRFMVNALLSAGGFGFANGAEFYATEKIDVHGCGALNYGAADNLNELAATLNLLLASHPAFYPESHVSLIQHGPGNVIAALRQAQDGASKAVVLLNCDCNNAATVMFYAKDIPERGRDVLSGRQVVFQSAGGSYACDLAPGEGLCVVFDGFVPDRTLALEPERVRLLRAGAMAKHAALKYRKLAGCSNIEACDMLADPVQFVRMISNRKNAPVAEFSCDLGDALREIVCTNFDLVMVSDTVPFRCRIMLDGKPLCAAKSLRSDKGRHFVLLDAGRNLSGELKYAKLEIVRFAPGKVPEHLKGTICFVPDAGRVKMRFGFSSRSDMENLYAFGTGSNGSYTLIPARFGSVTSKYDALLAANCDDTYPVDRQVMFSGVKAWLVANDYSQEINFSRQTSFCSDAANHARWTFDLPVGQGQRSMITLSCEHSANGNAVRLNFDRANDAGGSARLIVRCFVEDRTNHHLTRACDGAENRFRDSVISGERGFVFAPYGRKLEVASDCGRYCSEPEWHYMQHLPFEEYYGQDCKTDRFSPGYFEIPLDPGSSAEITAVCNDAVPKWTAASFKENMSAGEFIGDAMRRFVVRRSDLNTVIAGYPWFLDWGRDTLIVLRGLVKHPEFRSDAVRILQAFASFERNGTIPNVISGAAEANRDTSDAPLYLIVAVRDCIAATGDDSILDLKCGSRTMRQVLESIADNYLAGTPNGIKADRSSGLIYSPSHFTWMDTNYPAGTPRQGYPIEIQSLWYAALKFLGRDELASQVRSSIEKLFFANGSCSDCLHCREMVPAHEAVPDDHIRCNQLFAVTLGAVSDPEKCRRIISDTSRLVIPGAIRTLDHRRVDYQLPIWHNGHCLNDPSNPYWGKYCGPEDTSRKAAYHNGTAWCWPFPSYCEALVICGGKEEKQRALAILLSVKKYFETQVAGELPEVADGDLPHAPGGCSAQAWSVSEFYRVYSMLTSD